MVTKNPSRIEMRIGLLFFTILLFGYSRLLAQEDGCLDRIDLELNPIMFYDKVINRNITKQTILDVAYHDSVVVTEIISDDSSFKIYLQYNIYKYCINPNNYYLYRIEIWQNKSIQAMNYISCEYSKRTEYLDSFRLQLAIDKSTILSVCIYINTFNLVDSIRNELIEGHDNFILSNMRLNDITNGYKSNCIVLFERIYISPSE